MGNLDYKYYILLAVFLGLFVGVPIILTIFNIRNLIAKNPKLPRITLLLTIFVGLFYYVNLYYIQWDVAGDYNESIYYYQTHNALYSENLLSFWLPCIIGVLGLLILAFWPINKISPFISAFSIAGVIIGNIMNVIFAIQISKNFDYWTCIFFYIFHINIIILSIQWIRRRIVEQVELIMQRETQFRYEWMEKLYQYLKNASHMCLFSFIMVLPLALIIWLILVLFGQGPDGVIKVFTMTADWTFSQQIPPPPLEYDGHYLCTVAAGGHEKVVKPLRFGKRRGQTIVVNRQLCIANAFEELIQQRLPRFHKNVRYIYDTYGYPLSQDITTPLRADIVYVLMKPFEWIFLITLYLFDSNPESRIAKQYMWK